MAVSRVPSRWKQQSIRLPFLSLEDLDLTDQLLRSAIDAAPDGVVIVDDAGCIELANATLGLLFGYDMDELLGASVDILLPDALRPTHEAHRNVYTRHPRTRPMGSGLELHGRRKSGAEFPVEISLSAINHVGRTHVVAVVRDVTERRAASDELMRAHEQLALVDDRERIARDLHDTVIQRLFAVGLSLQGALIHVNDENTATRVETAIDEIDGTIRDIRTAIFSLHARRLATTTLRDDVLSTAREAARALGFDPRVTFSGPVDAATPRSIREQLVPTLREALSNTVRHAQASSASVEIAIEGDQIVLRVIDNGVGLDDDTHGGRGIGNMTERAVAIGGRCEIRSGAEAGTVVEWSAPLRPSAGIS